MKVIFMGTPDFAMESLKALNEDEYEILSVVTNPDRPKGRGMKLIASPVKQYAEENGMKIYQPQKVKGNIEFIEELKSQNPDVICVVAYGKLLPKEILDIPKYGCINVHGSLLPKYRGAAPIQWSVLNGDKTTGVTTIYMDEGMDSGDMILKEEVKIGEYETTGELWDRLSKVGAHLLVKTLKEIEAGTAKREKQDDDFTMAPMLNKSMAQIDWENQSAEQIKNLIRGLNPIMGAYTYVNNKKLKIWKAELKPYTENVKDLKNGDVVLADSKKGLEFKAKDGIIRAIEVQGDNGKRMKAEEYLRGNTII